MFIVNTIGKKSNNLTEMTVTIRLPTNINEASIAHAIQHKSNHFRESTSRAISMLNTGQNITSDHELLPSQTHRVWKCNLFVHHTIFTGIQFVIRPYKC